jgi:hypothetical protein
MLVGSKRRRRGIASWPTLKFMTALSGAPSARTDAASLGTAIQYLNFLNAEVFLDLETTHIRGVWLKLLYLACCHNLRPCRTQLQRYAAICMLCLMASCVLLRTYW